MSSLTGITTGAQLSAAIAAIAESSPGKIGQFLAFDALNYSNVYMLNGNTTALTPIEHFVQYGAASMAMPNKTFDPAYYKSHYADLSGTSMDAADLLIHFLKFGLDEGRAPNATLANTFNGTAYLAAYPAVATYVNANLASFGGSADNGALAHYVKFGQYQGFTLPVGATAGTTFNLAEGTTLGLKTMLITGDQDVRIDMTDTTRQITGLDLNGNGSIANDGKENALNVKPASGFVAVDAYTRLDNGVVNEKNLSKVFLGDIAYDGTGYAGDGVKTNGNIVLGGLGADTILGGLGNDFLAGGGVALSRGTGNDKLAGGRNADFIFAELSLLTNTDGNNTFIDGGSTADNTSAATGQSAQDTDWLLVQASDDDEPVTITLSEDAESANVNTVTGGISTRAGQTATLKDIENVDASGNFYDFLKGLSTSIGGAPTGATNPNNNGIGSSAQLRINGSLAANKLIGGYDNDVISGGDGNDLLMGGNLNYLINPNLVGLVNGNDGKDTLLGGNGSDNIAFEADTGVIDGGADTDTLWLTAKTLGNNTAAQVLADGVIRIDLLAQSLTNAAGYGGADVDGTQDQTNYAGLAGNGRVTMTNMESVTATGLGAIDYAAAGTNTPEIGFSNIQNFKAYTGNLDLRGSNAANTLYASAGADKIEGRQGDDNLSGGEGDDDFIFALATNTGDGVDVIHRQADANGDNLWDGYNSITGTGGTFVQDFGQQSAVITANSKLTLTLTDSTNPADLTGFPVNGVAFKLDGVAYTVPLTSGVQGTYAAFTAGLNAALDANPALAALDAVLNANNTITITDPAGKTFVSTGYTFVGNVVPPAGTLTWNQAVGGPTTSQTLDRLIYQSYADRADGEKTHDDAVVGSTISLGVDSYAQDLVVSFGADGTRIAEDQSYTITFTNLTTRDKVSIAVNGVTYTLQVGVDLDGNAITNEDVASVSQATIQSNFVTRLNGFINSFMDNDTAAGQVGSALSGVNVANDTLTLTQTVYAGEQTVFMTAPVVTLTNLSNGEAPSRVITNTSQHEVLLFNFDGRNGNLNKDNVLFLGDTATNRSNLVTAKTAGGAIAGTEAVLVDGGVDDLAGVALNTANNGVLQAAGINFSVHGDDFLIGGDGADTITAGTGDDRVQGSKGADVLDGGKNYYAVKVLGETEARVLTWNVWEAANPASAQSLAADPTLAGKTITSVTLIDQTESGTATKTGLFNDTLIYSQGDFVTGSTRFTIALNNYTLSGGVVSLNNGGAGSITVDLTGNGASADDSTSTFTNFENIRTVSGTGLAVAGVGGGQGNDTLNVAGLSTDTGGISYNLTNNGGAGEVKYSADAHANAGGVSRPVAGDFESLVINVDGVESVIGGTGDDLLLIDETEAAKDNSFDGGGANVPNGADRIEYQNVFSGVAATERLAQPVVTIKVGAVGSDVDTVTMTGGRVGTTVATDTLTSVEFITLTLGTATSGKEADVLDASALAAGAVVNYNDGTVMSGGAKQVTVENLYQVENVKGSIGSDTVIVASAAAHGGNTTSDVAGVDDKDLTIATFLDYNDLNASNARKPFATLTSAEITDTINEGQFKFNLGDGTADTVDYSLTTNDIAVRVELDATLPNQYVLVDSTVGGGFDAGVSAGDRVDVLTGVERIVAAQGESILDLTQSTKGLEVRYNSPVVADKVGNTATTNAYDVSSVRISDLSSASPLSRSYLELRDDPLVAAQAGTATNRATATWSRIEGSDNAERVILNSDHSLDATNTFNLRGGANEVKYNELTKSITLTLSVTDFVAATPLTTGIVTGVVTFQDGTGAGVVGPVLAGSGTHTITSYTANNGIASGSLRIAASQDAEDNLALAGLGEKLFLVSEVGTIDNQITVKLGSGTAANSVVLTGFELISDSASNDVYDFGSLVNAVAGLDFIDNAADHDTIKVSNDAKAFNGAGATEISLEALSTSVVLAPAGFDFDVLDVSKVTDTAVTTLTGRTATIAQENGTLGANTFGTTDEVVFGKISNVVSALAFESVVFTNATVTENGTTYALNTTTNTVTAGAKSVALTNLTNTISFGGTVLEQTGNTFRADSGLNVTTGVTLTVTGAEATSITGGNGADTITGAGGADIIRGGMGDDILDGGFVAEIREVHSYTISGAGAAAAQTITINGVTVTIGAATPGDPSATVVGAADADTIGSAFVRVWNANPGNFTVNNASVAPNTITSVAYDSLTNVLSFTYGAGANPADALLAPVAGTGAAAVSAVAVTAFVPRAESADIFKFDATVALNGADTINNFDATDTLNFGAYFATVGLNTTFTNNSLAGAYNLLGAGDTINVTYNKASLTAADFGGVTGRVISNDTKHVFITTGDANGAADAIVDGYNVYYVYDSEAGAGITYTVELIGTINSATEIGAGAVLTVG